MSAQGGGRTRSGLQRASEVGVGRAPKGLVGAVGSGPREGPPCALCPPEDGLLKVTRLADRVGFVCGRMGCRCRHIPAKHGDSAIASSGDRGLGTDAGPATAAQTWHQGTPGWGGLCLLTGRMGVHVPPCPFVVCAPGRASRRTKPQFPCLRRGLTVSARGHAGSTWRWVSLTWMASPTEW